MNKELWIAFMIVFLSVLILPKTNASSQLKQEQRQVVKENAEKVVNEESGDAKSTTDDESKIARCFIPTPPISIPNLPSITIATNCDFCDHDLYTLTCIDSVSDCANRCAADIRCTHFTYIDIPNVGTCRLKRAPGSGGAWATIIKPPSIYTCGYIPRRAFSSVLLDICVGLEISVFGLVNL